MEGKEGMYKWIAIGIAAIALIWVIYKVLKSVGLIKTAGERQYTEDKNLAQSDIMKVDFFKPSYYKGKKVTKTKAGAKLLAKQFNEAVRFYGTDESKLAAVIAQLRTKADVSFLNEAIIANYGYDFRDRLIDELDSAELLNVLRQLQELK